MYRGQLQLATHDAFYSDGDRYKPAIAVAKHIEGASAHIKKVLVLGAGLGSIVRVLDKQGRKPHYTLVEYDKVVLKWAMECFEPDQLDRISPVCMDAQTFMEKNKDVYDLIFIDIFDSRVVPSFVFTSAFLNSCKSSLNIGGRVAFNYIVNDELQYENVRQTFSSIFPSFEIVKNSINRIFISG